MNRTIHFLTALGLLAGCAMSPAAPLAEDDSSDVAATRAESVEAERTLGRGELSCETSGEAVVTLGAWDATRDLVAQRTDGCRGVLGLSRGAGAPEILDDTPRMYGAAMGVTRLDGTGVICANVVDGWETDETLSGGETVHRVAGVSIFCAVDTGEGFGPLEPTLAFGADAAWLQEIRLVDGAVEVGFLRDSRIAYQDFNGEGRPQSDGACHATLALGAEGRLEVEEVVHDEGYPWGPSQAIDAP